MTVMPRKKRIRNNIVTIAFIALLFLIITALNKAGALSSYHMGILSLASINVILVVSLNLVNGFTGQVSIGHAGFFAVGAYTSASLTVYQHIPFLLAILIGAVFAMVMGVLIGIPTLRLRGDYLAITTLGFGEIVRVAILNIDAVGASRGFSGIPLYTNFTVAFIIAVLTVLFIRNFVNSDHGRACIAIREDEIAADVMGINTTFYKILAFAIAAFFAGLAGGLFAHYTQYMSPQPATIGFLASINYLIMLVLGGMGSITGSVVSAVFLTALPELLRFFATYRMLIYPLVLIATMLFRPQGLMGNTELSIDGVIKYFTSNGKDKDKEKDTDKSEGDEKTEGVEKSEGRDQSGTA